MNYLSPEFHGVERLHSQNMQAFVTLKMKDDLAMFIFLFLFGSVVVLHASLLSDSWAYQCVEMEFEMLWQTLLPLLCLKMLQWQFVVSNPGQGSGDPHKCLNGEYSGTS